MTAKLMAREQCNGIRSNKIGFVENSAASKTQAEPYVRSPLKLSPGSLIMMMSTTSPMSRLMMCWPVLGYTGGVLPSSKNTVSGLLLFTLCKQRMPLGC